MFSPSNHVWGKIGALAMAFSIVMGAVLSHALQQRLLAEDLHRLDTASRYLVYAALGLLILSTRPGTRACHVAGGLLAFGALAFSGGLYGLALWGWQLPGLIPAGGISLILGWLWLALVGFPSASRSILKALQ